MLKIQRHQHETAQRCYTSILVIFLHFAQFICTWFYRLIDMAAVLPPSQPCRSRIDETAIDFNIEGGFINYNMDSVAVHTHAGSFREPCHMPQRKHARSLHSLCIAAAIWQQLVYNYSS